MSEQAEYKGYYGQVLKKSHRSEIMKWWTSLKENRGERARLRRCEDGFRVMLEPGFHRLLNSLGDWPPYRIHGLAMAAGLLAHIGENAAPKGVRFGHQLGTPREKGGKAPVSELRFSQLQKCRIPEDFYRHVRRMLHQLDRCANALSLAEFVLAWDRVHNGYMAPEPARRLPFLLAQDYFSKAPEKE